MRLRSFVVMCLFFAAGLYAAQKMPSGVKEMKTDSGTKVLATSKGMTLYTYSKDEKEKSMCNGPCATNWPPLMAPENAKSEGDWTVITRDDGAKQWAYKGMPVYTFAKDVKAGETNGKGMGNGAWQLATP